MTKLQLLFDANAIYRLIRELPDDALVKLGEGSTIPLAYYELGNALWRESFLLKRITSEEADKSLRFMYEILERMQITSHDSNTGSSILEATQKFNLTYYDSAYLVEAKKSNKTLVTDDRKLCKAAENFNVKTLSSMTIINNR